MKRKQPETVLRSKFTSKTRSSAKEPTFRPPCVEAFVKAVSGLSAQTWSHDRLVTHNAGERTRESWFENQLSGVPWGGGRVQGQGGGGFWAWEGAVAGLGQSQIPGLC